MEQLKEKIENLVPLVGRLKKYYEEIQPYAEDKIANKQSIAALEEVIALEPKLLERLSVIEQGQDNQKIIFQVFEMLVRYDKLVNSQETQKFSLSMFESIITKTEGQKLINDGMNIIHDLLVKNKKNLMPNILVFLSSRVISGQVNLDELEKLVIHYPGCMKLYIHILQHMINRFDDRKYQIMEYVERAKTIVLDRDLVINYPSGITRQPMICYFGLIPIILDPKIDPIKKYKKYNIILITRSTTHGVTLKFSETVDNFVSDKSIESSKVIIPLPKNTEKLKFEINEHSQSDWFVFDTDGENYRALQPWELSVQPIKRHYLEGLIQFIQSTKQKTASFKKEDLRRISKYNLLQEQKIMDSIFAMDPIDFDQLETEEDAAKLKQHIHNQLIKIPKRNIPDLLSKPKLYDNMLSLAYQEIPQSQEEHLTAIHQLGTLKQRFVKSVFQNYIRLNDITCIRAALDETINQNTSIDKGVLYKRKLISAVRIFETKVK